MENQTHPAVNFIKHFRAVHDRLIDDDRITAQHMSLYFALFRVWNRCRFRTPMPIIREDLMREARIGSLKTYTNRIYELHLWDYLRYEPTFNSMKGTKVYMYRFDKADDKADDKAYQAEYAGDEQSDKADDKAAGKADEKAGVQPLLNISINEINNKNLLTHTNGAHAPAREDNNIFFNLMNSQRELPSPEDDIPNPFYKEETAGEGGVPRTLGEVKAYFTSKRYSLLEAEMFYNYYCSIGWVVGKSGTPIRDWRSMAYNWILRASSNS